MLLQLIGGTVACVPSRNPDPGTTTTSPITTTTTTPITTTTTSTNTGTTTTTMTTTTTTLITTTVSPSECGTELMQTLTNSNFADGNMTFVYDNDSCRRIAQIICSGDPIFELNAGIVVNEVFFLDYNLTSVTVEGRWNTTDGQWYVSEEQPLAVQTLECLLTDPP
ncbi:unnamed protein product [Auanema sp. JU1783]|nr:unnamed protein product [Auanema sp. JU1783]